MPWTTPETFTAGQTLTAASMNVLSGNDGFLYKPPMAKVYRTTNQTSYTSGADIDWQAESVDTDGMWSSGNAARLTVNTAGVYSVIAYAEATWTGTATEVGMRITYTNPPSGGVVIARQLVRVNQTSPAYMGVSALYVATAGSYFTASFVISNGTSNIIAASDMTYFGATWVGSAA